VVIGNLLIAGWGESVLLATAGQTLLERLDPATRARVLAALTGLVILGFALVILAWLGARATRRYMRSGSSDAPRRRSSLSQAVEEDWAKKPITPSENGSGCDE
jgi:hypothetical protein